VSIFSISELVAIISILVVDVFSSTSLRGAFIVHLIFRTAKSSVAFASKFVLEQRETFNSLFSFRFE
jgi:uncharacterized protein YybS (DUF2232 family)